MHDRCEADRAGGARLVLDEEGLAGLLLQLGRHLAGDDVDRLLESATANRLYNAACAVAILADKAQDNRLLSHAMDLLTRAIQAGFPADDAVTDPDLKPLHGSPEFQKFVERRKPATTG